MASGCGDSLLSAFAAVISKGPGFSAVCDKKTTQFSGVEPVPDAAHAHQPGGLVGVGFDLLAQVADMGVDHSVGYEDGSPPDLIQELLPGEHRAALLDERRQELEFNGGHVHGPTLPAQLEAAEIDFEVAESIDLGERLGAPAQ